MALSMGKECGDARFRALISFTAGFGLHYLIYFDEDGYIIYILY